MFSQPNSVYRIHPNRTFRIFSYQILQVTIASTTTALSTAHTWTLVSAVIIYETGLLPQLLGWMIGLASLRVFNCSLAERMDLCSSLPVVCMVIHWIAGFFFLMHVNVVVSETRDVVRHDLLTNVLPDLQVCTPDYYSSSSSYDSIVTYRHKYFFY